MSRRPRKKKTTRPGGTDLRIRWVTDRGYVTPDAGKAPAFFQLETLGSAVERLMTTRDPFLGPSIRDKLGPAPLASLVFELVREEEHRLVFRIKAATQRRKTASFRLVVAKREGKTSERIDEEHQLLRTLHRRSANHVVRPYLGGLVYLPDRRRRKEMGRSIFAYLTDWPAGFRDLGSGPPNQFKLLGPRSHVFTIEQSDSIRDSILHIAVKTYDPVKREAIPLLGPNQAELHATMPRNGPPRVSLLACGGLVGNIHPDGLIHRILTATWDETPLVPLEAERFFEGLVKAVGEDTARRWMSRYHDAVRTGVYKPLAGFTLTALERLPLA